MSILPVSPDRRASTRSRVVGWIVAAAIGCHAFAAAPDAVRGRRGMVSSPESHATDVGVEVLRAGGNAIDAAVAMCFALTVTYPRAGNLTGGGFLLVRASDGTYSALDHRETAPAALEPSLFLDGDGRVVPERSREGGLAVGVPASLAGIAEAHRKFGTRSWKSLVAPAIRLADEGFAISRRTARSLEAARDRIASDPEARRIYLRDGRAPDEGTVLVQPDLAETLREIAERGPAAFYRGGIGRAIVDTVVRRGGVMSIEDLSRYRPVWRDPVVGSYRGHRIVSFPPPSSGGLVLVQILRMLERFDLSGAGYGASSSIHRFVEASRRGYADRARWMGDPDHVDVPVDALLDPAVLRDRGASIRDDRATPSSEVSSDLPLPAETPDTLHFSIVDSSGTAVAWTTTLNSAYGAAIVAPGTGLLLNNEIDDFALAPGVANQFGLVGSDANAVAGGKRPLSSMTPTIVERPNGGVRLVLGAPGGSRIISSVAQVIVNVIDHGMDVQQAVNAPRVHHQWLPDVVYVEELAIPEDVRIALEARGHVLEPYGRPPGIVAAVAAGPDGVWLGAADPRGEGTAKGW